MSASGFWDDPQKAQQVSQKVTQLKSTLEPWKKLIAKINDINEIFELAASSEDSSLEAEIANEIEQLEKEYEKLEIQSLLNEEMDSNNCFLYIHPGAGGTESCDWANMLFRMYTRWAEREGFEIEIADLQPGEEAGIRSVTVLIKGEYAYGYLKSEIGIHRLVRISPFDANKRRHTSFASVFVYPEIDDSIEININEADIRVDTYRSSGAGGQHVNKTSSAIRMTHIPTGIVVTCQNERSQHKNRATAMKILRARLYEKEREEREAEMDKINSTKKDISWGNQIRSYVFQPYCLVKDHRTGHETGNVQAVMDGDIEPFIEAYLKRNIKMGNS
jgi:peptide chain release factor 2